MFNDDGASFLLSAMYLGKSHELHFGRITIEKNLNIWTILIHLSVGSTTLQVLINTFDINLKWCSIKFMFIFTYTIILRHKPCFRYNLFGFHDKVLMLRFTQAPSSYENTHVSVIWYNMRIAFPWSLKQDVDRIRGDSDFVRSMPTTLSIQPLCKMDIVRNIFQTFK